MRSGMGNLLETDSDVASISDGEKERTDGDGMESDALVDVNKNANSSPETNDSAQNSKEPDKTADDNLAPLAGVSNKTVSSSLSSHHSSLSTVQPSTSGSITTSPLPKEIQVSSTNTSSGSNLNSPVSHVAAIPVKTKTVSPRELPPRSQLIQLKPTMCKPKLNSRNSMENSLPEGMNKQKNPRFIPYEPYRGAVRPMVAQDDTTKRHSRTASEASTVSSSFEQVIGNLSLNDSSVDEIAGCSLAQNVGENTHHKSLEGRQFPVNITKVVDAQYLKNGKVIEKQTHALTLLKERLKIAEKDNDDLHKENTRLKKLLVDSLSGDILHNRTDVSFDHPSGNSCAATNESVDTLSNEIEVWRSKFLSSCVLVEQLTKENGTLNEAVGAAANILKDIKLSSSLAPAHFDQVNAWLRANRPTSCSMVAIENNSADES